MGATVCLTSGTIFLISSHCALAASRRPSLATVDTLCFWSTERDSKMQSSSRSMELFFALTLYSAPITLRRKSKESCSLSGFSAMPKAPSVWLKNDSRSSSCFVTPFFMMPTKENFSDRLAGSKVATTSKRLPLLEVTVTRLPAWRVASAPVGGQNAGSARYTCVQVCLLQSNTRASFTATPAHTPPYSINEFEPLACIMANARALGMLVPLSGRHSAVMTPSFSLSTMKSWRVVSTSLASLLMPPKTYTASFTPHMAAPRRGLK
mmetsp:Transcript_1362/g.2010  ORF Transcript_1362/g.2010 Transcript_1362/m.2010 type:complete len:265 (-) Transcript_1362:224-1018(-)